MKVEQDEDEGEIVANDEIEWLRDKLCSLKLGKSHIEQNKRDVLLLKLKNMADNGMTEI